MPHPCPIELQNRYTPLLRLQAFSIFFILFHLLLPHGIHTCFSFFSSFSSSERQGMSCLCYMCPEEEKGKEGSRKAAGDHLRLQASHPPATSHRRQQQMGTMSAFTLSNTTHSPLPTSHPAPPTSCMYAMHGVYARWQVGRREGVKRWCRRQRHGHRQW